MAGRLVEDARAVLDTAALGIGRAPIEAPDAREGNRLGAHRTGFQRDIEIAAGQPRRAKLGRGGADHQHLGMGGGIAKLLGAIARLDQHLARRAHDHRADRHFATRAGGAGGGQGECHG